MDNISLFFCTVYMFERVYVSEIKNLYKKCARIDCCWYIHCVYYYLLHIQIQAQMYLCVTPIDWLLAYARFCIGM